jgi:putative hydrolase
LKPCSEFNVVADLHCHTLASSHAYSTITELAKAAAERGLVAIGCTDHGVAMPGSPHPWYFGNLKDLPDKIEGVRVLQGVEANVVDFDGRLDMDNGILKRLELVIASMHGGLMPKGSVEQCTNAWLGVVNNPHVDIIGHSGEPAFAYDYETVLTAVKQNGKVVELNEHSFNARPQSINNCIRIAKLCKDLGVFVSVNSDSHFHDTVGKFERWKQILSDIDFPCELIINSDKEILTTFLKNRGINF